MFAFTDWRIPPLYFGALVSLHFSVSQNFSLSCKTNICIVLNYCSGSDSQVIYGSLFKTKEAQSDICVKRVVCYEMDYLILSKISYTGLALR